LRHSGIIPIFSLRFYEAGFLFCYFFFCDFIVKAARQASGQDTLKTGITAPLFLSSQNLFSGAFNSYFLGLKRAV
jgi:hypothetical protein